MQSSMFNLRVPLEARDDVFLMNTLTDAQLVVSSDVAALLDRAAQGEFIGSTTSMEEREALALLHQDAPQPLALRPERDDRIRPLGPCR